jgi:magnesium transporter
MNYENIPELRWHSGYYLALGVIFSVSFGLWALFKRNDWL